jgi:hypothetical protein
MKESIKTALMSVFLFVAIDGGGFYAYQKCCDPNAWEKLQKS